MKIVLHRLLIQEDNLLQLFVSIGDEPIQTFQAEYRMIDPTSVYCGVEQALYLPLSEMALKKFGDCTVYIVELYTIIEEFILENDAPVFPATLGSTRYHRNRRPGKLRILWNKLWILLHHIGLYHPPVWVNPDIDNDDRNAVH